MQFPAMDEEEDFSLSTAARSRLSSLFQSESSKGDVNQALTFTAPKQPKKNDNTQTNASALKLIHAVVVHAYKLVEGNYANQGKLGCAILGQHENSSYKLLLYKGKQSQVTFCAITPSFSFHVQPNNYANFYDDKKENWSLNFDSEGSLTEFAKQVAIAKANSQGKTITSLVIQDFAIGEGPSLELNDSAEVKYTGWLLENHAFGQIFDSNMNTEATFRARLGKSKIIKGWSEGLLGCQKGSKRFLIIPSNLAYGSEGMGSAVPPNSTLIFSIHIVKVKCSQEKSHSPSPIRISENTIDKKPDVPPRQSFSQEDNIRMRGASISEQLSQSPKKDKAQIISRMAKMGTATLPFQGAVPAQVVSDSESEEEIPPEPSASPLISNSRTSSPKLPSKPRSRNNSGVTSSVAGQPLQQPSVQGNPPFHVTQHSSQVSLYAQAAMPFQQPYSTPSTTFPAFQPQMSGQYSIPQSPYPLQNIPGILPTISNSAADAHLPLLISETRSQNSEVRLSLAKITDKVDSVLQKVDDLRSQGRLSSSIHAPFMESGVLLQNIERIIQENTRLKEDIESKNNKIQALNEKICDLFQRNQRFFEESSNMLEQRSDSLQAASAQSQAKVINLEQENLKLSSELSEATAKVTALGTELAQLQKKENENVRKLLEMERQSKLQEDLLNNTKENLSEDQTLMNSLKDELKNVKHEKRLLSTKLENLEEKFQELQEIKDSLEKLLGENQNKLHEIKSKSEKEISEIQAAHENEIKVYEEKLNRSLSVGDTNSSSDQSDDVKKLKDELENHLKEKNDLQLKYQNLQKKMRESESSSSLHESKLQELKTQLENSLIWKKKYEVFYEKTKALKERYESQIVELLSEVKQLQTVKSVKTSPDFAAEIKKVMNILYKLLQGKFDANTSYTGSKVSEMTLQAIRGLTLQMLEMKQHSNSDPNEKDTVSENSKEISSSQSENFSENSSVNESDSVSNAQNTTFEQNGIENNSYSIPDSTPSASNETKDDISVKSNKNENYVKSEKLENGLVEDSNPLFQTKDSVPQDNIQSKTQETVRDVVAKDNESSNRDSPENSVPLPTNNLFKDSLSETEKKVVQGPFEQHA